MDNSVPKPIQKPNVVRTFEYTDKTILKLLADKDKAVKEGREISKEIEVAQKRIDELTEEEMKLTEAIEPKELVEKGDKIRDEINALVADLEKVAQDIRKAKLEAIPKEMQKEHMALNSKREKLEQERNKKGMKVQKIKDRLIPKIQKKVVHQLEEFEDLATAELVDGKCVIETFSHLEEWKRQWKARHESKE